MTQNISTIRSSLNDAPATSRCDVTDNSETPDEPGKASCHKLSDQSGVEVVCGPMELAKYVDLSGTQGVVPLTSMKLLKVKSKSFLLRFKSKSSRAEKSTAAVDKPTQVNLFTALTVLFLLSPPSERTKWWRYCFRSMWFCLSVCLSVHSGLVSKTSLKWLKLWTSNLTCFQGQSGHDPLKIFQKWCICKNSLSRDVHSHGRLLVVIVFPIFFAVF